MASGEGFGHGIGKAVNIMNLFDMLGHTAEKRSVIDLLEGISRSYHARPVR